VIGRIAQEVTEICFLCRRSKLVYPCFPARELVEAEHIHDTDLGQRSSEQIRSLINHCADQESAIRSALNRQAVLWRDSLRLKILARRDEIVEDVLLVLTTTCFVPCPAIFGATANIGDRVHSALFDPPQRLRRESGNQGDSISSLELSTVALLNFAFLRIAH
jgi:hypothetical protein